MLSNEFDYLQSLSQQVLDYLVQYGFQLLGAVIIILLGWWFSAWGGRAIIRIGNKRQWDQTLVRFFANLARLAILAIFIVIAAGKLGITISPLIAAIGAATFGLSLAVQGPISNYGAGVAIVLTRPFSVGDTLELLGRAGLVEDITLAQTVLVTEDGERIHIPNRKVLGEIYQNSQQHKLAETTFLLPAGADPQQALRLLESHLAADADATAPPMQLGIDAFTAVGVRLIVRAWLETSHYHQQRLALNLKLFEVLKEAGMAPASPSAVVALSENL
ncbi:mechanosensitive ion channel family protein [Gallaecimonas mangrovi]|uniref:mechanosensitive ion channel family protein n=1 Tax=Gallaecimonas mangrovi TaxID=2291597 RepID=UPI000E2095F9|nr:mechanosensitive ion channel family protein [Gallaecimonas mangrovi]